MNIKYKYPLLASLLLSALFMASLNGCGGDKVTTTDSGGGETVKTEMVLRIGNGTEPQDLDPAMVTGVPESKVIQALIEGLTCLDQTTLEPLPAAAESWEISADKRTYTFHIRKNGLWSNGDPVTSYDFSYAWFRLLDPEIASSYAYMGWIIVNGREYNEGKITDTSLVGISTPDSKTFVVTLKAPTPYFLQLVDHHSLYPVHPGCVKKHGARWTRPENYVGNGAFVLTKWETHKIIEVEKSSTYWDKDIVKIDRIEFHPTEDESTEERKFRAGKLDITNGVPLERIPYWKDGTHEEYKQEPYLGVYYYEINTKHKVLSDVKVRMALAYSIDRKTIVEHVTRGGQVPAFNYTPPIHAVGFVSKASFSYDTELARKLLAEAGYPGGKGFPDDVELLYNTSESHRKIAEAIQQMWKDELGIHIGLYNQEWKVFLNTKTSLDFAIARAGWISDYPDPNSFIDMYVSGNGNNTTNWSNPEYDDLIEKASLTGDKSLRFEMFQRCEEILVKEFPIIPIYHYTRVYLRSPRVKGFISNDMDHHPYKYLSVE